MQRIGEHRGRGQATICSRQTDTNFEDGPLAGEAAARLGIRVLTENSAVKD